MEKLTGEQMLAFADNVKICVKLVKEFEKEVRKPLECLLNKARALIEVADKGLKQSFVKPLEILHELEKGLQRLHDHGIDKPLDILAQTRTRSWTDCMIMD